MKVLEVAISAVTGAALGTAVAVAMDPEMQGRAAAIKHVLRGYPLVYKLKVTARDDGRASWSARDEGATVRISHCYFTVPVYLGDESEIRRSRWRGGPDDYWRQKRLMAEAVDN